MALACAALLLSSSTPAAGAAAAQRRRRQAPRTRPAARPAPRPAAPTQTPTPAPGATPAAQPTAPAAQPTPTPQARRPEADPAFEELLAADAYTVYAELRRVGTLARTEEVKSAVAALRLLGGEETRPWVDFYTFISDNADVLGESRIVMAFMPARTNVPQGVVAFELESPQAAVAFEPKLRRVIGEQVRQVRKAMEKQPAAAEPAGAPRSRVGWSEQRVPGSDFALRRAGRWLVTSDGPFKLRQLRGEEGGPTLADSTRFQTVRSRFGNDSLFVYVDTDVAQQAWALQVQKIEEANPTPEGATDNAGVIVPQDGSTPRAIVVRTEPPAEGETPPEPPPAPAATPDPDATPEPSPEEGERALAAIVGEAEEEAPPPPPSAEELAVRGLGRVMQSLWGGAPRIPGAVALGATLDRGALAVRLGVENTPDGTIALIPFLPNIVSGPPVTGESAAVAPADAELFVAGSLDWARLYNSTLGAASVDPAGLMSIMAPGGDEGEDGGEKAERQPTADEAVAAVEKLFGFKFKEDLLPALGNEVGFSTPLDARDFGFGISGPRAGREKEEKERDAEPGPVFVVSLNDTAKMREILPRVFVALGFASPGVAQAAPEKREGFEIRTLGASDGISYAIINNFLVVGELKAVRYCVDAFSSRRTLAASNEYRDATAGYQGSYGDESLYRNTFRQAFEQGYRDGYEDRNRNGRTGIGVGDILGGILGRP